MGNGNINDPRIARSDKRFRAEDTETFRGMSTRALVDDLIELD